MTVFQEMAVLIAALWLVAVAVRFQRSPIVLVGGLVALGLYAFVAFLAGQLALRAVGGERLGRAQFAFGKGSGPKRLSPAVPRRQASSTKAQAKRPTAAASKR